LSIIGDGRGDCGGSGGDGSGVKVVEAGWWST